MSYRIMVADNSPAIRKILSFMLKNEGYEVIEAEDGLDALKKIKDSLPDIVFADLNMPNMNGLELIRKLKEVPEYRCVPVVMVTNEGDPLKKKEAKDIGARAWISKPIKPGQFTEVISKIFLSSS